VKKRSTKHLAVRYVLVIASIAAGTSVDAQADSAYLAQLPTVERVRGDVRGTGEQRYARAAESRAFSRRSWRKNRPAPHGRLDGESLSDPTRLLLCFFSRPQSLSCARASAIARARRARASPPTERGVERLYTSAKRLSPCHWPDKGLEIGTRVALRGCRWHGGPQKKNRPDARRRSDEV
jgi:hypothetical protein